MLYFESKLCKSVLELDAFLNAELNSASPAAFNKQIVGYTLNDKGEVLVTLFVSDLRDNDPTYIRKQAKEEESKPPKEHDRR